jgi:hypothetical protein
VFLGIAALSIRSPKNERSREHAQVRQLQLIALVARIVVIFGRFVFARTARQSLLGV